MLVVDSSVWIDFFAERETPHALWLRKNIEIQTIGVPDLVLFEVTQGVLTDRQFTAVSTRLLRLHPLSMGGAALALQASRNYRTLRSLGSTIRVGADCIIATFCIANDHTLLHRDRDFDIFERELGLRVIHP